MIKKAEKKAGLNRKKQDSHKLDTISEGVFKAEAIVGELADMCKQPEILRQSADEITLFKSVGTAVSDLVGAYLVYQKVV